VVVSLSIRPRIALALIARQNALMASYSVNDRAVACARRLIDARQ
jgi:hypothetical protein